MWNPSKTWNSEPAFYSERNPGGGTEAMAAMIFRDQSVNLARMPGLHTYSFSKNTLGFLMTTESQEGVFQACQTWKETLWQTQDTLEGLYQLACLGTHWDPPE